MKLISKISSHYKGKKYLKNWVIIPNRVISELGWKKGVDLDWLVDLDSKEKSIAIWPKIKPKK